MEMNQYPSIVGAGSVNLWRKKFELAMITALLSIMLVVLLQTVELLPSLYPPHLDQLGLEQGVHPAWLCSVKRYVLWIFWVHPVKREIRAPGALVYTGDGVDGVSPLLLPPEHAQADTEERWWREGEGVDDREDHCSSMSRKREMGVLVRKRRMVPWLANISWSLGEGP
jgi:hypothetical protein